ncbi:winged helix DNA-binding domain-containing protein [Cryobacterium tagatosivorans]|uniref:Winged helix DNA-binding domain-containing protein n=1 Tax=Cryobacterium tagatosivorans TaxID=1259199 RepID=A0A4R8UFH1_9MICO|nr:winged helix DNA-binding domain-containing protein [Cryobacterium tagatosivorans]TFB53091.1 winged helix DNA-binding domain-containing protein [Cryobacterium tagatosivorans]
MSTQASRRDVTRIRLVRQGLSGGELRGVSDVAERLLALQAQDYAAGKWALGVRAPGATLADVDAAINSGAIVRSWPMRGTLHFVPAAALGWMQELTSPRVVAGSRTRHAQLDLDPVVIERARAVAVGALSGGRELSRADFLAALDGSGISTAGQRGYHLIGHLALTGTLCWGPQRGKQQVLVLLDDWVPSPRRLDRDEALGEFVLRYFDGHGPATLRDFVWWSQLTLADARVGLAVARDRLAELEVDGVTHYLPAAADTGDSGTGNAPRPPRQRRPVLALPAFDEYLIGYQDRSFAIDDGSFTRVVPGRNGMFLPLILASGRVIGTWRQTKSTREVSVEPRPFATLSANQAREFGRAVADYARFLGLASAGLAPNAPTTPEPPLA